jgi:hypothetical protein
MRLMEAGMSEFPQWWVSVIMKTSDIYLCMYGRPLVSRVSYMYSTGSTMLWICCQQHTLDSLTRAPDDVPVCRCACVPCRWIDIENNQGLQQYANYGLGTAYGLIALVALVSWLRVVSLLSILLCCLTSTRLTPIKHTCRCNWSVFSCVCQSMAGQHRRCSTS